MTAERSYQFTSAAPPAKPVAVDTPGVRTAARPRAQVYWFHPDHLGTGTLITDLSGKPHQFFLNLPFGETFIEQGGHTYDNPYIPTSVGSKELDEETGLYYYGARYYDPMISLWLSVDPLAEKYPGMSPYNYTAGNPVVLVDPDGRGVFKAIGNIFKRIYNGIYNVFVSCPSQKRYVHKTIREAWAEPEFPLTLIQKLRRPRPYRRPYHKVWRQPVSALNLPSIEAKNLDLTLSSINIYYEAPYKDPIIYTSEIKTPTRSELGGDGKYRIIIGLPTDQRSLEELDYLASLLTLNKNYKIMIYFPHQKQGYTSSQLKHLEKRNKMEFEVLAKYLMKLGVSPNQLMWGTYQTYIKNPWGGNGFKLPLKIKILFH